MHYETNLARKITHSSLPFSQRVQLITDKHYATSQETHIAGPAHIVAIPRGYAHQLGLESHKIIVISRDIRIEET